MSYMWESKQHACQDHNLSMVDAKSQISLVELVGYGGIQVANFVFGAGILSVKRWTNIWCKLNAVRVYVENARNGKGQ